MRLLKADRTDGIKSNQYFFISHTLTLYLSLQYGCAFFHSATPFLTARIFFLFSFLFVSWIYLLSKVFMPICAYRSMCAKSIAWTNYERIHSYTPYKRESLFYKCFNEFIYNRHWLWYALQLLLTIYSLFHAFAITIRYVTFDTFYWRI